MCFSSLCTLPVGKVLKEQVKARGGSISKVTLKRDIFKCLLFYYALVPLDLDHCQAFYLYIDIIACLSYFSVLSLLQFQITHCLECFAHQKKKLTDFVSILSANLKTAFTSHPVVLQFFSCPYKDVQLLFMPFQFDIKNSGSFLLTKLLSPTFLHLNMDNFWLL